MAIQFSFQLQLLLSLVLTTICVSSAANPWMPRIGMGRRFGMSESEQEDLPPEFVTYFYTQTLDHFNYRPESYATFEQKYIVNSQYWGGPNNSSPIFVSMGDEGSITSELSGFIVELASRFQGLLLYIEHRYYGDSMPFGSRNEAYQNASTLGYFTSTQALADYAQLIVDFKRNMSAVNSPVITVGGSYGGMLASWFRLKYPHIAMGALASSAPILYFDKITPENGYYVVVTEDYKNCSESCYNTIRQSWFEIDSVASQPNGLVNLSSIFRTCGPLESSEKLKGYLERIYEESAQYNNPPDYPVSKMCNAIDGTPEGTGILSRVAAGLNASSQLPCNNVNGLKPDSQSESTESGWSWQTCTEIVMQMSRGANETMFQAAQFDMDIFTKNCEDRFGVTPRPHWITTEFGGQDIKSVLGKFASNIIFSNGLQDPYSSGGVLQNISDSVVAIWTEQGAHCLDLVAPRTDDPDWLVSQRDKEIETIAGWLAGYNSTHASYKSPTKIK